jgi:hypothetical protein
VAPHEAGSLGGWAPGSRLPWLHGLVGDGVIMGRDLSWASIAIDSP